MRAHQRGVSLVGMLILGIVLVGGMVLAVRCVPAYNEYFAVKSALNQIAAGSDAESPESIRHAFQRRADLGGVTSIGSKDLDITKDSGHYVIFAQWERQVSLIANVSLVFAFQASSRPSTSSSQ